MQRKDSFYFQHFKRSIKYVSQTLIYRSTIYFFTLLKFRHCKSYRSLYFFKKKEKGLPIQIKSKIASDAFDKKAARPKINKEQRKLLKINFEENGCCQHN